MSNKRTTPPLYDLYYLIRNLITPYQNLTYLIIEAMLIGLFISSYLYLETSTDILISISVFVSFSLISLTQYLWTKPKDRRKEHKTLQIDIKRWFILTFLSLIPFSTLYIVPVTQAIILVLISTIVYTFSLYVRSKKYLKERYYFTNPHGQNSTSWYYASLYLEKGIKHEEDENPFRAYYWSRKSEKEYKKITETENRHFLQKGARELKEISGFINELIFADDNEKSAYYSAINNSIKNTNKYFSRRLCDKCGEEKQVSEVYSKNVDGKNRIFCQECYKKEKQKQKQKQREKQKQKQRRNKSYSNKRNQRNSQSTNKSNNRNTGSKNNNKQRKQPQQESRMSVKKACSVLNIEKPFDESDVSTAYKKQVKKTHPDVGGSEEEFKKTQEAKNVLIDNL